MDAYDFIFWQEEKGYDFGSSYLEGLSGSIWADFLKSVMGLKQGTSCIVLSLHHGLQFSC
ncbi:hypothetical protein L7F22_020456, partial [Adiantum nelumboides]|nr:hypothetical protein [Adiantum nelumboides]